MIPADPDFKTISLPTISMGTIALAATNFKLDAASAEIAKLVAQIMKKVIVASPFIAIPFMVTGLYGVIPYFIIDPAKLAKELEVVISAALQILIAALLAYLAAKKAAGQLLEEIQAIAKQLELVAQMFIQLMLAWTVFCLLVVGLYLIIAAAIAEAPVVIPAVAAAAVLIIIVGSQGSGSKAGSEPESGEPPPTLDIHLGALRVRGLTADQFASWIDKVGELFANIWAVTPGVETVDVAPLQ
jgi:hypothetical protein